MSQEPKVITEETTLYDVVCALDGVYAEHPIVNFKNSIQLDVLNDEVYVYYWVPLAEILCMNGIPDSENANEDFDSMIQNGYLNAVNEEIVRLIAESCAVDKLAIRNSLTSSVDEIFCNGDYSRQEYVDSFDALSFEFVVEHEGVGQVPFNKVVGVLKPIIDVFNSLNDPKIRKEVFAMEANLDISTKNAVQEWFEKRLNA